MAASNPNPDEIDLSDEDFYNESNDYEVAEDPAMAAAMGFTSFGGTRPADDDDPSRPSKKRRFNPHADNAFISINEPDVVMAHRAQTSRGGKGGKGKPKSKPSPASKPKPAAKPKPPKDEISYSDSDDDTNPKKTTAADDNDDDFILDTTAIADEEEEEDAEDLNLDWEAPTTRSRASTPATQSQPQQSQPQTQSQLPPKPTRTGTGTAPMRGGRGGAHGGHGGRGGQTNPLWYVDYYDSSSNENPWEGMEKFKNLEPVGTWLARFWERGSAGGGGATGGGAGGGDVAAGEDAAGEGVAKGEAEAEAVAATAVAA
jgi:hypothetical protein